jgi:hypothetical protein
MGEKRNEKRKNMVRELRRREKGGDGKEEEKKKDLGRGR